ncbi:MAG: RIP metalloprotease RseP [Bacteroidales bacterium]
METFLIKAFQLMMALAILVTVHEFGHYIFARIFGVRVEKFYLFFNPWFSLFKYTPKKKEGADPNKASWRDTTYGIGWVPLGGYVKIAGMIDESMDKEQMMKPAQPWEFRSKPAYQRLLIMVAGVVFNFILAIGIYSGIVYTWGEEYINFADATEGMAYNQSAHLIGFMDGDIPLLADDMQLDYLNENSLMGMLTATEVTVLRNGSDSVKIAIPEKFIFEAEKDAKDGLPFISYRMPVVIAGIENGMGAAKANLAKGDKMLAINGVKTTTFTDFKAQLDINADKDITLEFIRGGEPMSATVAVDGAGRLGIQLTPITEIYKTTNMQYGFFESIPRGIELGVEKLTSYISQMSLVFTPEGAQSLGGFGALGSIFPESWNWLAFWNITAFLSVVLAFMNILPIPALDGGHVLFLLYEMITRRAPSEKFLEYAQIVGMVLLFGLLIFANGNDIYRAFFK